MKVIVAQNDPVLGKKGDVIIVSDGHAVNYLLPRRKVILATSENLALFEKRKKKLQEERQAQEKNKKSAAEKIRGRVVHLRCRAKEGKLFGAIHAHQIAQALKTQYDILIEEGAISLPQPIKKIGQSAVIVILGKDTHATFTVSVTAEE
ncbi:MAG TPA: 50S ribosomal protein L9 [Patescibacteria group bacterium]|nr:50S ribosomal protein L9 [Patescibacteria group bacterium]